MPDTGNAKDCLELPLTNFSTFTLIKNVTWRTYLISFPAPYCFLFRFVCQVVCIELFSLIWFLQIWDAIYVLRYYDQLVHFDKEIHTNVSSHSGSIPNVCTVHLKGIWHLISVIWRYLLKPVLGGHPVLSGHYRIPRGCSLFPVERRLIAYY